MNNKCWPTFRMKLQLETLSMTQPLLNRQACHTPPRNWRARVNTVYSSVSNFSVIGIAVRGENPPKNAISTEFSSSGAPVNTLFSDQLQIWSEGEIHGMLYIVVQRQISP